MKKTVLFLACGLLLSSMTFAQKFGYINSAELLQAMPEIKKANADAEAYAKTFQEQLQTMGKEYESKVQAYQASEKTMSDAVKEVKVKEIQDLQARIESFNQSAQEKVGKKKEELYKPVLEKADKAIKDVAKEKGFDYVFDTSSNVLLYAKETDDILPLVKTKLGIK
ncbi:OmpH family outer membrane protein [Polluticoccus soli]|uniref:OmpH family outer membrane protein n=1 Tax=Polluticoccus soli TaxID=3034150 RepID=UPI0023E0CCA5|nr:OmpH family outer membrane protein [Flavipsychrobacter sp. JY13-12]